MVKDYGHAWNSPHRGRAESLLAKTLASSGGYVEDTYFAPELNQRSNQPLAPAKLCKTDFDSSLLL